MSYIQELEELITNVVIPDVNNELDAIFEEIADNKEATEDAKDEIAELRELKEEFQSILDDIQSGDMDEDESKEVAYFLPVLAHGKLRDVRANAFKRAFKSNPPTIQKLG